jgi:hypothetical protein
MNATTSLGLKRMMGVERPLKFLHLKGLNLGSFNLIYHLNDGFIIDRLTDVSIKEQLLFQRFASRDLQLNLMMVDTIFPLILAELTSAVLLHDSMTFLTYVNSGKSNYSTFLLEHKMQQFINMLLYSDVAATSPFSGDMDYERLYYCRKSEEEIEYYSIYDKQELQNYIYEHAVLKIAADSSVLNGREIVLALDIHLA